VTRARRIVGGDVLTTGVFYGLPLYPYFLALCYAVSGRSVVAVKVVQIVLGLLTLVLTYATGALLADATVGLVAAALAAVYGPLVFHESMLIPEAIGVPLHAGAFYCCCLFLHAPTERAIEAFRAALRFEPGCCAAATNPGHALELAGRVEEARSEWRKAVERDPSCDGAKRAPEPS
jgi:tetratricopeptide (TPR) repeat protein